MTIKPPPMALQYAGLITSLGLGVASMAHGNLLAAGGWLTAVIATAALLNEGVGVPKGPAE